MRKRKENATHQANAVIFRSLLCGFLVSLTFSITQIPMMYVVRVMTCNAFYEHHTPDPNAVDKCMRREVEAGASRYIALIAGSTAIFGLVNLLVTAWTIKRLGIKLALITQIFWPAVRVFVQNIGILTGSTTGIWIIQASQIITILGGPNGYVLCLNSLVADFAQHEARTGALGRLQGCMYVGSALGFLVGGIVGDFFGIIAPWQMAFVMFLLCCLYITIWLPVTPAPKENKDATSSKPLGLMRFFGPLRIFAPQKWALPDGRVRTEFGALLLGIGVYLGITATGYIPVLLQMYSTSEFNFGTKQNGGLIFIYSLLRGSYLTLVFPRVIAYGRKWFQRPNKKTVVVAEGAEEPLLHDQQIQANEIDTVEPLENEEPAAPPRNKEDETFEFDLFYARFSLLLDGFLTGLAVFLSQGWQMYIFAVMLPFAAGTGSAAKGSILQMLPSSDRTDALSGITLVENVARLSTTAVFGLTFAALAEIGKAHLTFVCNAAVALLGFLVLVLSRFPPEGVGGLSIE